MKKILLAAFTIALLAAGCDEVDTSQTSQPTVQNGDDAQIKAIIDEGYTDPSYTGGVILGCGEDDSIMFSGRYEATNSNGKRVKLIVCGGWFKGYTVRHE